MEIERWARTLSSREKSLSEYLLAHQELRSALTSAPVIEIRASEDNDFANPFCRIPLASRSISGSAAEAHAAVRGLPGWSAHDLHAQHAGVPDRDPPIPRHFVSRSSRSAA